MTQVFRYHESPNITVAFTGASIQEKICIRLARHMCDCIEQDKGLRSGVGHGNDFTFQDIAKLVVVAQTLLYICWILAVGVSPGSLLRYEDNARCSAKVTH